MKLIKLSIWFIKESKPYLGYMKENKNECQCVFGMVTDYVKKPFNPKNKVYGLSGVEYPKYLAWRLKDLIYFPIAYIKFMKLTLKGN